MGFKRLRPARRPPGPQKNTKKNVNKNLFFWAVLKVWGALGPHRSNQAERNIPGDLFSDFFDHGEAGSALGGPGEGPSTFVPPSPPREVHTLARWAVRRPVGLYAGPRFRRPRVGRTPARVGRTLARGGTYAGLVGRTPAGWAVRWLVHHLLTKIFHDFMFLTFH